MTAEAKGEDFAAFFHAVHGYEPFPWQVRLTEHVVATGRWPTLLDLPTGTGKTAVLDTAVFSLAVRGDVPRRIVFVVDRRIIVHQAAERARAIVSALAAGADPVATAVADRLRALAPDPVDAEAHPPLRWTELRGGIVRDESWALRPDVPAVLLSTVDQIGSRLLFRGYGVTRGMRPIHAGLLGNDALILLDEVHLARPFRSTVAAIRDRYRPTDVRLPERWQVVELSATPGEVPAGSDRFTLGAEDRDATRSPTLHRRLAASKPAVTRLVKTSGKDAEKHRAALAAAVIEETERLIVGGATTVGVVVNRVATAVAIHRGLLSKRGAPRAALLTGRMRPLDREDLLGPLTGRIMTGRTRQPSDEPLVLVSTQAVEAGADFDFDALVTECAPLDALRQRFGRVDRDGLVAAAGAPPTSAILATSTSVADDAEDPIYGGSLRATWAALQDRILDFGYEPGTLGDLLAPERLGALTSPSAGAPQLLPSHLDRWAQTSNPPHADPVPAHWLHGLVANVEDVTVVWRADLPLEALGDGSAAHDVAEEIVAGLVAAVPLAAGETMAVSLHAVKSWLEGIHASEPPSWAGSGDMGDAAVGSPDPGDGARGRPIAPVAVVRGDEVEVVRTADRLRPGATVVVPAGYGGIHAGTWDPTAQEPVVDLATRAIHAASGRFVIRLAPATLPSLDGIGPPPGPSVEPDVDQVDEEAGVLDWLAGAARHLAGGGDPNAETGGDEQRALVALSKGRPALTRVAMGPPVGEALAPGMWVLSMRAPIARNPLGDAAGETVDSEPETSSFIGQRVTLEQHLGDVERWARRLASSCGFPPEVIEDAALAGWVHDLGKADPRFQVVLRGGEVAAGPLLAKSASPTFDRRQRIAAMRAAGYPRGTRHELLSVALIEEDPGVRGRAHDWDLVLHLVASHHGYARPFVPVAPDPDPAEVHVAWEGLALQAATDHCLALAESGVADRFWLLVERYGWWGLAWIEAVLRLADHRASAAAGRDQERAGRQA